MADIEDKKSGTRSEEDYLKRIAELEKANKDLADANRAKSAFLASINHELLTPLNAIIGYSELLEEVAEELEIEEEIGPDLNKIHSSGKHLLAIINNILDLSKIEAGKMEFFSQNCDLEDLANEVSHTLQPIINKNSNTLKINLDKDLGSISIDITRLRQVLFNLLSNACKFTEKGEITFTVARKTIRELDWVNFTISDSGIGMDTSQVEKLFKSFFQVHSGNIQKYGRTGLGLAITKRICEMMGGDIFVQSKPDKGSTFPVHLPAVIPIPETANITLPSIPKAGKDSPESDSEPQESIILVIDDDPMIHNQMKRTFDKEGYKIVCASDGEEGLALARKLHPTLITLDVLMPGMDGWTVLKKLKGDPEVANIPVFIISMVDEENKGYTMGASEYLTKPIDRTRLHILMKKYHWDSSSALVAEDDPGTLKLLCSMLEEYGLNVQEARNGKVALERVQEKTPGVIFLDLMMPEMDGFKFIEELKKNPEHRPIPIVVVTAKDPIQADRLSLNGGGEKLIEKKLFVHDDLLSETRSTLATHHS
ncbi:MAG TPA: response regulator [Nitrospinae bacterium]|nr:response regulator [Nitrospinota bacterium]